MDRQTLIAIQERCRLVTGQKCAVVVELSPDSLFTASIAHWHSGEYNTASDAIEALYSLMEEDAIEALYILMEEDLLRVPIGDGLEARRLSDGSVFIYTRTGDLDAQGTLTLTAKAVRGLRELLDK